ncbi:MAG TPA: rubredoxin [Bacteroidia bacterium]|nr:rubredoxin [Sphingobacteriales bacterium]HPD65542.1 rubredoxin [Bacteroidia bacterium]HRS59273.1 rubredoxin [Bacteroidia bacterium]HRU67137.1 rubredoxin [Bacteroidia bacterium]
MKIRYKCQVCGYVYDPDEGDPQAGIEKGTDFDDLPEDWQCPLCQAGKDAFTEYEYF